MNIMKLYCPHTKRYTHVLSTDASQKKVQDIAYKVLNIEDYNYDDLWEALDKAGIKYELITLSECIHIDF